MKTLHKTLILFFLVALCAACGTSGDESDPDPDMSANSSVGPAKNVEMVLYGIVLAEENGQTCGAENGYIVGTFVFKQEYWNDETDDVLLVEKNIMTGVHPNETSVIAELEAMGFMQIVDENIPWCSFFNNDNDMDMGHSDAGN